jgi:hypothetical protein
MYVGLYHNTNRFGIVQQLRGGQNCRCTFNELRAGKAAF